MAPRDVINLARTVINDINSAIYRQPDSELLNYVNEALKAVSLLRKDLFMSSGDFTCTPGQTEQAITFSDAQALIEVIRVKDGKAVHAMDMMAMSRFNPDWAADTAAPIKNWTRFAGDPLRFYIYPKAPPEMQVLEVMYVRNPATYAIDDTIGEVPETIMPSLANYVIYRAESKDDEHSNSGRAASHYSLFLQGLGVQQPAAQGA